MPSKIKRKQDIVLHYRPISEIIRLFVLPEIEKRLNAGTIAADVLPLELSQFLAYQKKGNGKIIPVVQLNEEFNMTFKVKLKKSDKKFEKGRLIGLEDIMLEECYIVPPECNGRPCAYFYFRREFLNPSMVFDCNPNVPSISDEELRNLKMRYPIGEVFKAKRFIEIVGPYEKTDVLISKNWPPNRAYYPKVFAEMHKDSNIADKPEFLSLLGRIFNQDYWKSQLELWGTVNLFPKRLEYIRGAVEEHLEKDYDSAIYTICPQFEGIIRDYLALLSKLAR